MDNVKEDTEDKETFRERRVSDAVSAQISADSSRGGTAACVNVSESTGRAPSGRAMGSQSRTCHLSAAPGRSGCLVSRGFTWRPIPFGLEFHKDFTEFRETSSKT